MKRESQQLIITKVTEVATPEYGTSGSAGLDFFVPMTFNEGDEYELRPGSDVLIASGIKAVVPRGHALICHDKSGVATRHKLKVGATVVDSDYRGEIHLHLFNVGTGRSPVVIKPGMKLCQFLLMPVDQAELVVIKNDMYETEFNNTERGEGRFGSTGG